MKPNRTFWSFSIPLVLAAAAGAGYLNNNSALWTQGTDTPGSGSVAVVSLNMAKESNLDLAFRDISGRIADADILLLQEVSSNERTNVAAELARKLDRHVAFAPAAPGVTDQGLAIVSRYPLRDVKTFKLKPCDLRFRSRFRIGLAATAETPSGPMRVIDIHLDTRINTADRLAQLRPAIEDADAFDGPKLIGGDFNTNDMYWVGNIAPIPRIGRHSLAVLREFERHGYTTPFGNSGPTFPSMRLHLDWIYVKGIEARAAGISRVPFSDHHAIWTRLG